MPLSAADGIGSLALTRPSLRMAGAEGTSAAADAERAQLGDAAKRFAGLLAQQFVHGMLEGAQGLVGTGPGKDVLQGLLEDTLAAQVMDSGSIGLEPTILRQISPLGPAPASAEGPLSLDRKSFSLEEPGDDASHDG